MCLKTIPHIQLNWQSARYQGLSLQLGSGGSRDSLNAACHPAWTLRSNVQVSRQLNHGRYTNV